MVLFVGTRIAFELPSAAERPIFRLSRRPSLTFLLLRCRYIRRMYPVLSIPSSFSLRMRQNPQNPRLRMPIILSLPESSAADNGSMPSADRLLERLME